MWILLVTCMLVLLVLHFLVANYKSKSYFESKGIQYIGNGTIRVFLNIFRGIPLAEDVLNQYNVMKKKNVRIGGGIDFGQKTLLVSDMKLLKTILVKDFDHFTDRRMFPFGKNDSIVGKMLLMLEGDLWKQLRTKLSPTFTTGKIKRMFHLFDQSGQKFVKFLESEIAMSNGDIELAEGYSKFAMDIIASAVCGFDSQAFNQKEPSLFEQMGKALQFKLGGLIMVKLILMNLLPINISDFLGFSIISQTTQQFFTRIIKSSINQRTDNAQKRDDFIELMLAAREGKLKTDESELDAFEKDAILKSHAVEAGAIKTSELLDDDGIVSNCVLFIVAGFDTTQSLLFFSAYALALHQDVQGRLRTEVDQVLEETNGVLTYDGLAKMTYLDMVINETLRFWPPAVATDRKCTAKEYKLPNSDFLLKRGDTIRIPIYGIHHDETFYPNPEKFDPERFSPENKSKIHPYAFLPFGQGPRNCIGMRFALTEAKVVISQLVHNFYIEPSPRTLIPMKFANSTALKPEGGLFLALNKIERLAT